MPTGHYPRKPLKERIWEKVNKTDSCWLWTSATKDGYGVLSIKDKTYRATRIVYALYYGDFDPTLHVLHHCDNPSCVRPDHLFLGTAADNHTDAKKKGRIPKGERHWNSKLSQAQVLAIRASRESSRVLGNVFGIHPTHAAAIRSGRSRNA